jgi:hypothetical protein
MCGTIPPLPQYAFMAWCSVKNRENFTFVTFYHAHVFLSEERLNIRGLAHKILTDGRRNKTSLYITQVKSLSYTERIIWLDPLSSTVPTVQKLMKFTYKSFARIS